jgi:iron complex outermembrane receptor protein
METQDPGTNFIAVRGITQVRFGEPSVAFVIDGVQSSSPDQGTPDLYDVERIEVLKGPQSSTYGRNAIGGAVSIVTREPSKEFENEISGEFAEGPFYRVRATSSGPIVEDKILYRLNLSYRDDEGLYRNVTLDEKVDHYDEYSARLRVMAFATDRLTLDFRGSFSDLEGGSAWYSNIIPPQSPDDRTDIISNRTGNGKKKLGSFSLKTDYTLGAATLTSITAFETAEGSTIDQDVDFLPWPISPFFPGVGLDQTRDTEAWSEELRLASNNAEGLSWLAGAYYLDTHREVTTTVFLDLDTVRGPVLSNLPEINRNKAYAIFGSLDYPLSDQWELSFGVRQDWDKRKQRNPDTGSVVEETFSELQPKVSISYFATPEHMVYASAGRGFRSGGFNVETALFPRKFEAETADTFEVGTRTSWMERRFLLNGALFYTRGRNAQTFRFDGTTGTQGILTIDKTYFYGIESDFRFRVSERLELSGGLSWLETEMQDYDGTSQYRGNPIPLVNERTYNLGLQYTQPVGTKLSLLARLDYNAFGDLAWHVDNVDRRDGVVDLLNLRVGLESDTWSVVGYVENLLDEEYTTDFEAGRFTGTPLDIAFPGRPRRVGATLSFKF